MNILETPRAAAYRLAHSSHSAWLRWKCRELFDRVERFCLFVGYPRKILTALCAYLELDVYPG